MIASDFFPCTTLLVIERIVWITDFRSSSQTELADFNVSSTEKLPLSAFFFEMRVDVSALEIFVFVCIGGLEVLGDDD